MIDIEYLGYNDYRVNYSNISQDAKPNIKRIIAHSKTRFEQRFNEPWAGNYLQAQSTFAYLANQGLNEREIFEMVDWFYGLIADRVVHSFSLLRKLIKSYRTFSENNKSNRRSEEDWYSYCTRLNNIIKKRNQSQESLDDMIYKICKEKPKEVFMNE